MFFLQRTLLVVVVLALDENDVIHLMIRRSLCSMLRILGKQPRQAICWRDAANTGELMNLAKCSLKCCCCLLLFLSALNESFLLFKVKRSEVNSLLLLLLLCVAIIAIFVLLMPTFERFFQAFAFVLRPGEGNHIWFSMVN